MPRNAKKTSGPVNKAEDFERAVQNQPRIHYVLRLFVTGITPRSTLAIQNIKKICEENLKGRYELEVVDIFQEPEQIRDEQVLAAPTLIKELPLPLRRIIGDMSDTEKILVGLDLKVKET